MYKQKLTLDPKLSEVCEATLTVYDPEPLNEEAATEAVNFTVVGSGVISAEEKAAHQKMRAVAPLAAGEKDVAITSLECVSIDGDVLPAQFQMYYEFHVANYSDEAIASVPVTIYFNTPNSDLVAQGTTTVSNIPAGHYQALQFAFPGVVAGTWMMSMEANQPRAFEESDYTNNLLSKTFTYVNKAELVAEEVSAVTDDPAYDSSGRPIIYYDVPTTLDFCVSNISAISASNVLLQVPAAFQDSTGAYSTMLTEGKIDMPANTRRHVQLNITFTKPATAQIGVVLNSDRACDEVSYDNNEASQVFIINKYNPSTGPDPGEEGLVNDFILNEPVDTYLSQRDDSTWVNCEDLTNVEYLKNSGCSIVVATMAARIMENDASITARDLYSWGVWGIDPADGYPWAYWTQNSQSELSFEYDMSSDSDWESAKTTIYSEIIMGRPVIIWVKGPNDGTHFVLAYGLKAGAKPSTLSYGQIVVHNPDSQLGQETETLRETMNSLINWSQFGSVRKLIPKN